MRPKIDLIGKKFTRLLVIKESCLPRYKNNEVLWECICDCGKVMHIPGNLLRQKIRKSCGCLWKPHDQEYVNSLKTKLELNCKWQNQCQIWTGNTNLAGLGITNITSKTRISVCKLSWLIHVGYIPKGKTVHQICNNKLCFRTDHLILK